MSKNLIYPSQKTLNETFKLSVENEKNISYYFFQDSQENQVCLATHNNDKLIYKNKEEHSSPIIKTFKCETEYIVITENTIYVISAKTQIKK